MEILFHIVFCVFCHWAHKKLAQNDQQGVRLAELEDERTGSSEYLHGYSAGHRAGLEQGRREALELLQRISEEDIASTERVAAK